MEPLNELPGGVWTLAAAFITAVTSVSVAIAPRWVEARERIRQRYGAATGVLTEWLELPYRIARRTSDDPEVLAGLAQLGHELQERTARTQAEMAADHRRLGALYTEVLGVVRSKAGQAASAAWNRPPVSSASAMNVGNLTPDSGELKELITLWGCVGTIRLAPWRLAFVLPELLLSRGTWNRYGRLSVAVRHTRSQK